MICFKPGTVACLKKGASFPFEVAAVDTDNTIFKAGHITKTRFVPNKDGVYEQEFQPWLRVDYVVSEGNVNTIK